MNSHLVWLVSYSVAQLALGVWISRRVKTSSDFFVAGRALGPGLLFSTMLAATGTSMSGVFFEKNTNTLILSPTPRPTR